MIQHILSDFLEKYNVNSIVWMSLAIFALISFLFGCHRKDNLSLIPYKYPFIGSTMDYYKNPFALIKKYTKKFGPQFRIHFHGDVVTVVGADDAMEVFSHPGLNFMKSQNKYFNLELLHGSDVNCYLRDAGFDSISKTIIPNLSEYGVISYKNFLIDVKMDAEGDEFVIDNLGVFLKKLVSRGSASVTVGEELCRNEQVFNVFQNCISDIGKDFMPSQLRIIFPFFNKLYMKYLYKSSGAIEKYRNLLATILSDNKDQLKRRCKTHPKSCSTIGYIMENYFDEIDNEVIHILTTIVIVFTFVSAHTTSEAITYVAYCLVKHPEYIEALREEQESLLPEFERDANNELIPTAPICRRMVKLDSFIQEALRIRRNGIGLAHTNITNHDVTLRSGVVIRPDEEVYINLWHINFDENNQAPLVNLETFDGFRFINKDTNSTKCSQDNLIFGLGRHTCPGRWFAVYQIKSILSYFIRKYDFEAVSEIKMVHSDNEHVELPQGSVKFTKRVVVA